MISWIAMFLSLFGVVLNARKNIWCWPVWIISNFVWAAYNYQTRQLAPLVLVVVLCGANIFGWRSWSKGKS
jgi:nicotinamide mononucleotide transporter